MQIIVITGPTCTSKSEIAYNLAKLLDAEIINGDAFQIYKELDIGTAKPCAEYLKEVKHHLYSFIDANKPYSVYDYQKDLREVLDSLISKNKNAIIVGGSGLFIRAALYDYEFSKEDHLVDMSEYDSLSNEELYKVLEQIDPEEAKVHHPNNRRRVLRAIEIYLTSGSKKSDLIKKQKHKLVYPAKFFVRNIARDELYQRINSRVDKMIEQGLVDEVKAIQSKYGSDIQALSAIGYKELLPYLNNEISLDEAVTLIKQHTRNYAKRQYTFVKHQFDVNYFDNIEDILKAIK